MVPRIGSVVHWIAHREDGRPVFDCENVVVTAIVARSAAGWALEVADPEGRLFGTGVQDQSLLPKCGTWHWPEKV